MADTRQEVQHFTATCVATKETNARAVSDLQHQVLNIKRIGPNDDSWASFKCLVCVNAYQLLVSRCMPIHCSGEAKKVDSFFIPH